MNFLKSKLAVIAAIVAVIGFNNVQASEYQYQKPTTLPAYGRLGLDSTTTTANSDYYNNGIVTRNAKDKFETEQQRQQKMRKKMNPGYKQQIVEEQMGNSYNNQDSVFFDEQIVEEQ